MSAALRTMPNDPNAKLNRLLAALPEASFKRLAPDLEYITMTRGENLCESGRGAKYLYFPTSGAVALVLVLKNGIRAGTSTVGREGVVGIGLFLGGTGTDNLATVQQPGGAFRLRADRQRREFRRGEAFQALLLRYTQARMKELSQSVLCQQQHNLAEQLACCLLFAIDRGDPTRLRMTHAQIAESLGVRRETVSLAAQRLQASGCIQYDRGNIAILDRRRLESCACECYGAVRKEYALLQ